MGVSSDLLKPFCLFSYKHKSLCTPILNVYVLDCQSTSLLNIFLFWWPDTKEQGTNSQPEIWICCLRLFVVQLWKYMKEQSLKSSYKFKHDKAVKVNLNICCFTSELSGGLNLALVWADSLGISNQVKMICLIRCGNVSCNRQLPQYEGIAVMYRKD